MAGSPEVIPPLGAFPSWAGRSSVCVTRGATEARDELAQGGEEASRRRGGGILRGGLRGLVFEPIQAVLVLPREQAREIFALGVVRI